MAGQDMAGQGRPGQLESLHRAHSGNTPAAGCPHHILSMPTPLVSPVPRSSCVFRLLSPPQVLGAKRKNLAGFSSTTAQPHQGFIFGSDIIQQTPPSLRSKAARLVGAKCTLLARIDAYGQVGRPLGVVAQGGCWVDTRHCEPERAFSAVLLGDIGQMK